MTGFRGYCRSDAETPVRPPTNAALMNFSEDFQDASSEVKDDESCNIHIDDDPKNQVATNNSTETPGTVGIMAATAIDTKNVKVRLGVKTKFALSAGGLLLVLSILGDVTKDGELIF